MYNIYDKVKEREQYTLIHRAQFEYFICQLLRFFDPCKHEEDPQKNPAINFARNNKNKESEAAKRSWPRPSIKQKLDIIHLHESGLTFADIAKQVKTTPRSFSKVIEKYKNEGTLDRRPG